MKDITEKVLYYLVTFPIVCLLLLLTLIFMEYLSIGAIDFSAEINRTNYGKLVEIEVLLTLISMCCTPIVLLHIAANIYQNKFLSNFDYFRIIIVCIYGLFWINTLGVFTWLLG